MKRFFLFCVFLQLNVGGYAFDLKQYTFMPQAGRYIYSSKQDIDNAEFVGFTAGYIVDRSWRLEFSYSAIHSNNEGGQQEAVTTNTYLVDMVRYFRNTQAVKPVLLAGVGVIHNDNPQDDDDSLGGSANVGAGLEYMVNPMFSLRTDVRNIYQFSGGYNDLMWSAGLNIYFGKFNGSHTKVPYEEDYNKAAP